MARRKPEAKSETMSILSSVTSILKLMKIPEIGVPRGDGNQSKWNDDHKGRDDYSKNGDKDDYSKHVKDDYSKHATNDDDGPKGDYSKHDGAWKEAKNDNCQPHTYHDPGDALAKFDFAHGDFASGPDHSGDMQAALASMSSDDALEYAIGQMGPADHFDVGHFDVAADTSNDTNG
jgi:hypothetical protein